jgi:hypothetical protein
VISVKKCTMVTEEKVCCVPYTTCRMIPREHVKCVPQTTCRMEPYCETQKVCRRISFCVPICSDPCETIGPAPFAPPLPAVIEKK